jgi:DNA-binding transcriptional LysR family regulator
LFLAAIQEGFGIGMAPTFYKFVAPDLVTLSVIPECHTELWLCWHEATKTRAKVRAITSFLKGRFLRDRARWFS